jgi:hypothetical protein
MGALLTETHFCVEQCEKCSHRRPIIWWKPNFFCQKIYCPRAQWFSDCKCDLYEEVLEPPPPKKFSGFHLL